VKKIVKQGACSALIDQPDLAKEIVLATKEGTHLPVSVKTRTGIRQHETERWINQLLDTHPAALTLHGRTQNQQSDGRADWNEIAKAVRIRNERETDIPVLGNGDVFSWKEGIDRVAQTGVDGVMIGRGIFHDPWFFQPGRTSPTPAGRADMLLYHTRLFEQTWSGKKNFNILKRFYKIYLNQFTNAAHIRAALMETKNYDEVYRYFEEHPVAEAL
jgi:tRNA-dihydrouridine synthase